MNRVLYVLGAIVLLAIIFQLFFRYDYRTMDGVAIRIDRLTQQVCVVRVGGDLCSPAPSPTPYPTASEPQGLPDLDNPQSTPIPTPTPIPSPF